MNLQLTSINPVNGIAVVARPNILGHSPSFSYTTHNAKPSCTCAPRSSCSLPDMSYIHQVSRPYLDNNPIPASDITYTPRTFYPGTQPEHPPRTTSLLNHLLAIEKENTLVQSVGTGMTSPHDQLSLKCFPSMISQTKDHPMASIHNRHTRTVSLFIKLSLPTLDGHELLDERLETADGVR